MLMVGVTYLIYVQDIQVLSGIMTQQEKFAKNFYIILMEYFDIPDLIPNVNKIFLISFVIIYFFTNLTLLFKKKIKFGEESKKYEYFLMAFLFLLITNFQTWYIMWLFGLITEVDNKDVGKIIALSIIAEISNFIFYYLGESYVYGGAYFILLIMFYVIYLVISNYIHNNKLNYLNEKNLA